MKKSQYFIFFVIVTIISCGLYFFMISNTVDKSHLSIRFKTVDKFKVGETVNPVDLIASSTSTRILYPTIDTKTPGIKRLTYIAVGEHGEQKEFMKEIRVIDPVPPTLQLKTNNVTITTGESFEPKSYIQKAYSNFDGDLKVKISGTYDTKKAGVYVLIYEVTDSSDNKVAVKLMLYVKEKPKVDVPKPKKDEETITEQSNNKKEDGNSLPSNQIAPPVYTGKTSWLFADGDTFASALDKCNAAGSASGRSYQCNVLQDSEGIYIGYKLLLR